MCEGDERRCFCGATLLTVECLWCSAFPGEVCGVCGGSGQVEVCARSRCRPAACPNERPVERQLGLFDEIECD